MHEPDDAEPDPDVLAVDEIAPDFDQAVAKGHRTVRAKTETVKTELPWWATTPREDFGKTAEEKATEMSNSKEGRKVGRNTGLRMTDA